MQSDWNRLPDELQLRLTGEALRLAVETIARQAEVLAREMELGELMDRGGADALRLLAAVARSTRESPLQAAGHG